jgi:AcrR family transcriptional regulator
VPKKVDHAHRRRTIAEALWQVVIRDGLDQVSLRSVAAEAGISMGMVQHYFASKDDMLVFALDSLTEQVGRRIAAAFAALGDTAGPRERVRASLVQTLPLDDERRVEAMCGVAFLARAPVDARIAEYFRTSYGEGHRYLTEQLALAGVAAPERQAHLLFALADGLNAHALAGHHTPQTALAVLDDHLDQLFPSG